MSLTVEDGTIVAGADSYISLNDAKTYATSRGITLNGSDASLEVHLRAAFDYINSFRDRYVGMKTDSAQVGQWPRLYATRDSYAIDSDAIPDEIKYAQVYVAAAQHAGIMLNPNADGSKFVTKEKVGSIETNYSDRVSSSGQPILYSALVLLSPFFSGGSGVSVQRA